MATVCPLWPECGCGTQSGPHTCEYRVECWRRYGLLGIDPHCPDPDGSDYHLMNKIDEEVWQDYMNRKL
jgi:hypothetical protein